MYALTSSAVDPRRSEKPVTPRAERSVHFLPTSIVLIPNSAAKSIFYKRYHHFYTIVSNTLTPYLKGIITKQILKKASSSDAAIAKIGKKRAVLAIRIETRKGRGNDAR